MSYRKFFLVAAASVPLVMGVVAQAEEAGYPPASGRQFKEPSLQDLTNWHKSMCGERYAHESARLAYLQARLELTEPQKPAFRKWADAVGQAAGLERDACLANTPKSTTPPSIVDRESVTASELRLKLQGLETTRPALQALYDQLTAEQRAVLDRPHGGPEGRHHHSGRFEGAGGGHRRFG